jgi:hypothetical protein
VAWISKHGRASIVASVTARKARGLKQTIIRIYRSRLAAVLNIPPLDQKRDGVSNQDKGGILTDSAQTV